MTGARHTLLVADGSHIVRRIVEMACADSEITVIAVDDGQKAVASMLEHRPDLVLVETGLQGRDGFDVASFVKQHREMSRVPVLLMARMSEAVDEVRAGACGCAEVIFKPLRPPHLLERVRYWLSATAHTTALEEAMPPAAVPDRVEVAAMETRAVPVAMAPEPETVPSIQGFAPLVAKVGATPAETTEAFFDRLDAAFRSLDRPVLGGGASGPADGAVPLETEGNGVPTLHELLERLPEDTRRRLTPPPPSERTRPHNPSLVDAVVERVLDRFVERPDLLEEIARRITARQAGSGS